jgi:hypothetical protein
MSEELTIMPSRMPARFRSITGIFVRAQTPDGKWVNADIAQLDEESLTKWLRSRGGDNPWAESVVRILLGHE